MTVFLNANSVSELKFNPPGGSRATAIAVPVKKEKLEEFFPRTQRELPGYLYKEVFKSKLAKILLYVLEGMRNSHETMGYFAVQNTQGGYLNPALKSKAEDYPKKLNDFHHAQHVRQTNMELKSRVLEAIEREDWYTFEKMEMADKVYEESKRYLKAAGTEVAMFAAGFGIGKIGKPIAKSSKTLKGNVLQQDVGLTFKKADNTVKTISVNRGWSKDITFTVGKKEQTLHLLDGDLANADLAIASQVYGEVSDHSHPEDKFESFDCLKNFGLLGVAASVMVPYIGIGATITNTLSNVGLGFYSMYYGDRIRAIEDENNKKNAEFLSKLKQYIYDDFNELDDNEIEALMENLGIKKKEYISL